MLYPMLVMSFQCYRLHYIVNVQTCTTVQGHNSARIRQTIRLVSYQKSLVKLGIQNHATRITKIKHK